MKSYTIYLRGLIDGFREAHHLQLDLAHFWLPLGRTPHGHAGQGSCKMRGPPGGPSLCCSPNPELSLSSYLKPLEAQMGPRPRSAQPPHPLLCRADHPPPVRATVRPHRPWRQVLCPLLQPRGVGSAEPRRSTWAWAEWVGACSQSSQATGGTAMGQVWLRASDPRGIQGPCRKSPGQTQPPSPGPGSSSKLSRTGEGSRGSLQRAGQVATWGPQSPVAGVQKALALPPGHGDPSLLV